MKPQIYLFGYLFLCFIVLPILINYHPKRMGEFWRDKQYLPSYPRFVAILLTLATLIGNVLMFAGFPRNAGIVIATVFMLAMLNTYYTSLLLAFFRRSVWATYSLVVMTIGLALTYQTFPVAVMFGLVQMFSCLLPKNAKREAVATSSSKSDEEATAQKEQNTSCEAHTASTASCDESKESVSAPEQETDTTSSIATDSLPQPADASEPQQSVKQTQLVCQLTTMQPTLECENHKKATSQKARSQRPNRHSNPSCHKSHSKSHRHHRHG